MIASRLRRVVRSARPVRRLLGERFVGVEGQVAVDLASRHVMEPYRACSASSLEQRLGSQDIRMEEAAGIEHGEAVVRFGCEVDDDVQLMLAQGGLDESQIGDVAL